MWGAGVLPQLRCLGRVQDRVRRHPISSAIRRTAARLPLKPDGTRPSRWSAVDAIGTHFREPELRLRRAAGCDPVARGEAIAAGRHTPQRLRVDTAPAPHRPTSASPVSDRPRPVRRIPSFGYSLIPAQPTPGRTPGRGAGTRGVHSISNRRINRSQRADSRSRARFTAPRKVWIQRGDLRGPASRCTTEEAEAWEGSSAEARSSEGDGRQRGESADSDRRASFPPHA